MNDKDITYLVKPEERLELAEYDIARLRHRNQMLEEELSLCKVRLKVAQSEVRLLKIQARAK